MKNLIPLIAMLLFTISLTAQPMADKDYKQAKEEIKEAILHGTSTIHAVFFYRTSRPL